MGRNPAGRFPRLATGGRRRQPGCKHCCSRSSAGSRRPRMMRTKIVGAGSVVSFLHGRSDLVVGLGDDLRGGNSLQVVAESAKRMDVCHGKLLIVTSYRGNRRGTSLGFAGEILPRPPWTEKRLRFDMKPNGAHPKTSSPPAKISAQECSIVKATPASQRTTKLRLGNLSPKFDKNSALRGESCANIRPIEVSMARLDEGRWSSHPMAVVRSGCLVLPWDPTKPHLRKNLPSAERAAAVAGSEPVCDWPASRFPAFGQTDVNDVHVLPREVDKPPDPPKADLVATTTGLDHARARAESRCGPGVGPSYDYRPYEPSGDRPG